MRPFWLFVFIFALIVGFHRSTTNIADKSFLFNIQKFIYWIFYLFCHLSFQFTVDPSHNLDDDEVHNTQQHYLVLVVHFKLYLKIFTNFIQISSTTNFYTSTNSYHKLTKPTVLTNKKLLNIFKTNFTEKPKCLTSLLIPQLGLFRCYCKVLRFILQHCYFWSAIYNIFSQRHV